MFKIVMTGGNSIRGNQLVPATEQRGNNSKRFDDFFPESQGQSMALTVSYVTYPLDSRVRSLMLGFG